MGPSDTSTWFLLGLNTFSHCQASPLGEFCILNASQCILTIPSASSDVFTSVRMLWMCVRTADVSAWLATPPATSTCTSTHGTPAPGRAPPPPPPVPGKHPHCTCTRTHTHTSASASTCTSARTTRTSTKASTSTSTGTHLREPHPHPHPQHLREPQCQPPRACTNTSISMYQHHDDAGHHCPDQHQPHHHSAIIAPAGMFCFVLFTNYHYRSSAHPRLHTPMLTQRDLPCCCMFFVPFDFVYYSNSTTAAIHPRWPPQPLPT